MKKIITAISIMILLSSLSSCRKLALHGDFSGMWQVLSIQWPDGTVEPSNHEYSYCFNRNVVMLRQYGDKAVLGNMVYHETDFTLQFPGASMSYLRHWGIIAPTGDTGPDWREFTVTFTVDRRTSSQMVITSDQGVTVTLRKY